MSNEFTEPRPEDEGWREKFWGLLSQSDDELLEELGFELGDLLTAPIEKYISDLESKLQDVREELFYKESYIQRLRERLNNARGALRSNQERIKEAREYVIKLTFPDGKVSEQFINSMKSDLHEILSPDSDEGND